MKLNPTLHIKKDFNSIALKLLIFAIVCGALYWYASSQFNGLVDAGKVDVVKSIEVKHFK